MAESTLSLQYTDFFRGVGNFLGHGWYTSTYSTQENAQVEVIVQTGYRRFLFPEPLAGESGSHVWSFLSPLSTLDTAEDDIDYDLPDTFGGLIGDQITINESGLYQPIPVRGEGQVRAAHRASSLTGRPQYAAVRPKSSTGSTGQRFELLVYPTPDGVYTMEYRFNVLTGKLTVSLPYPLGGAEHGDTIMESCLSVAEQIKNNERGLHTLAFKERLAASVSYDRRMFSPPTLGYNGDNSDSRGGHSVAVRYPEYEGVIYGDFAP